jgi:hypothetical protein
LPTDCLSIAGRPPVDRRPTPDRPPVDRRATPSKESTAGRPAGDQRPTAGRPLADRHSAGGRCRRATACRLAVDRRSTPPVDLRSPPPVHRRCRPAVDRRSTGGRLPVDRWLAADRSAASTARPAAGRPAVDQPLTGGVEPRLTADRPQVDRRSIRPEAEPGSSSLSSPGSFPVYCRLTSGRCRID